VAQSVGNSEATREIGGGSLQTIASDLQRHSVDSGKRGKGKTKKGGASGRGKKIGEDKVKRKKEKKRKGEGVNTVGLQIFPTAPRASVAAGGKRATFTSKRKNPREGLGRRYRRKEWKPGVAGGTRWWRIRSNRKSQKGGR